MIKQIHRYLLHLDVTHSTLATARLSDCTLVIAVSLPRLLRCQEWVSRHLAPPAWQSVHVFVPFFSGTSIIGVEVGFNTECSVIEKP